jgi:hypothetical protein
MTLTTTHPGFTLDFRANILRGLAQRWDGMIFTHDMWLSQRDFTQAEKNASIDRLIDRLTLGAAEYAAPDMPMADIRGYMEDLRDAVNALARFEVGDGWDGDDSEKAHYTDDMVLALLNQSVDDALWPLLNGMSGMNVCFWCSRHKSEVTRWNVREAGSSRCTDCQEKGR